MRRIDLHCYPGTQEWITAQGPFVDALGKYWNRAWTAKTEDEVVKDFADAGVEAVLVAFDIETASATPPCSNEYVAGLRDKHRDRIIQAWAAVDPFKGEVAIRQATTAIRDLHMLGFHFHPIMRRFAVDDRRFYPLWETIAGLGAPVMIDVGTTGMGAGLPGGLGAKIRHAHPLAIDELAADFPTLTIDRRDDGRGAPQGQRLLGALGLGAEILSRGPQARRPGPAAGQDHVRQRLPGPSVCASAARVARARLARRRQG